MKLADILSQQVEVRRIPDAQKLVRESLSSSNKRLVVVDDDPTGTQTVHNTRVLMDWSVGTLRSAFSSGDRVFFISTNSRSMDTSQARALGVEVGRNLREAAHLERADFVVASRSDSTLRGHYPDEVDALSSGLQVRPDGIIIVPAFFEGGRYTIDDIQWAKQDGEIVPAHETEFARDPVFGFRHSNLKDWVVEKTRGKVQSKDVYSLSLTLLREGGPTAVSEVLLNVSNQASVVANAACYEDLEVLVLGILSAESRGKCFFYRCAASFVKARGGFEDRKLLTHSELVSSKGPGLIVVGSYVEKTSRQLTELLASGLARGIELRVRELMREENRNTEVESVARAADEQLSRGITAVIYTSREASSASNQSFLETGKHVMAALCYIVRRIRFKPNYVVAKGGITGIEVARAGLDVGQTLVLGQIIKGVPVWRLGKDSRWPDIPYVVFPGNVGDDFALRKVTEILQ
jgi:uncharacterized protein YgbK (DUF1537 family)